MNWAEYGQTIAALKASVERMIYNAGTLFAFFAKYISSTPQNATWSYKKDDGTIENKTVKNIVKQTDDLESWKNTLPQTNLDYRYLQQSAGKNVKQRIALVDGTPISNIYAAGTVSICTLSTAVPTTYTFAHFFINSASGDKVVTVLSGNAYEHKSDNIPYLTFDDEGYLCWSIDHEQAYTVAIKVSRTY